MLLQERVGVQAKAWERGGLGLRSHSRLNVLLSAGPPPRRTGAPSRKQHQYAVHYSTEVFAEPRGGNRSRAAQQYPMEGPLRTVVPEDKHAGSLLSWAFTGNMQTAQPHQLGLADNPEALGLLSACFCFQTCGVSAGHDSSGSRVFISKMSRCPPTQTVQGSRKSSERMSK